MRAVLRALGTALLLGGLWGLGGAPAQAVDAFPPLVSEGETLGDVDALLRSIAPQSQVLALAWSPDGRLLASAGDEGTVRLWEVSSGREVRRLKGYGASVWALGWSPDGRLLASGGKEGTVRLWEVSSGREVRRLEGHGGLVGVQALGWSPDGRLLASGGQEGTIRLWEVSSGREVRRLQGPDSLVGVQALGWSPDGRLLASGGFDGTVRIYTTGTYALRWIASGGQRGTWVSCQAQGLCWRYDDGSLLHNQALDGTLTSLLPPRPAAPGQVEVVAVQPAALSPADGEASPLTLTVRNRGQGRVYWLDVRHDVDQDAGLPLVLRPPATQAILEPGATTELQAEVFAPAEWLNPQGWQGTLHLLLTTAHGEPQRLSIPVTARAPSLSLSAVRQTPDQRPCEVEVHNVGQQDLTSETVFVADIAGTSLDKVTRQELRAGETATLAFALPAALMGKRDTRLTLTATKLTYPVREWVFTEQPITLPRPAWYLYTGLVALFLGTSTGAYYLRLYRHPLVAQLSGDPARLAQLPLAQLGQAQRLLRRTRRLEAVLASSAIQPVWLNQALAFADTPDPARRSTLLAQRLRATCTPRADASLALYTLRLGEEFMLNIEYVLLVLPPMDMTADEVLTHLQQVEDSHQRSCLLLSNVPAQQDALRQASQDPANWLVTPDDRELTGLWLSERPAEALAQLIASQVRVTRIAPYQTRAGVSKDSIFFGRTQLLADIMQREPANYLLVGGRQLGKSSLLRALQRRYVDDPRVQCHYLVLGGAELRSVLARELGLPVDSALTTVLDTLRQGENGRRRLLLIDEADLFVDAEARQGYPILQQFRSLSESGQCHFILAGFWGLYRAATFDYQAPIRNFGATLVVGALEPEACQELATKPMQMLNLRYEAEALVTTLVQVTGGRANLIALLCTELRQC